MLTPVVALLTNARRRGRLPRTGRAPPRRVHAALPLAGHEGAGLPLQPGAKLGLGLEHRLRARAERAVVQEDDVGIDRPVRGEGLHGRRSYDHALLHQRGTRSASSSAPIRRAAPRARPGGPRATPGRRAARRAARRSAAWRAGGRASRPRGARAETRRGDPCRAPRRASSRGRPGWLRCGGSARARRRRPSRRSPGCRECRRRCRRRGRASRGSTRAARRSARRRPPRPGRVPRRRSRQMTFWPTTHCEKSLSGEQITTCSTPAASRKRAAAVARASSASNSTIGQTTMPSAATACSAGSNCASRSGSMPSPVL